MAIGIIVLVILLLLLYILLVPVVLNINTDSNEYYFRVKGLLKASVEPHDVEIFRIKIHTLLSNFYVYPLREKKRKKKKKKQKTKKESQLKRFNKKLGPYKIFRLIRTFKIRRFYIDFDTGDCVTNAKLYPLIAALNYRIGGMHVNFQGRNSLALQIENRVIFILKELLTSKKLNYGFTF